MIKSGFYNIIGGCVRLVVGLLSFPLMIRLLDVSTYGMYAIINSVAAFAAINESSVLLATTIFVARFNKDDNIDCLNYNESVKSCLQATVALSIFLFAIFYSCSFFIAPLFISNEAQQSGFLLALQLCAGQISVRLLQQFFAGLLQAHHQFGIYNVAITVYGTLMSIGTILVAYWYPDLRFIFGWQLLMALAFLLYYYYYCRKSGIYSNSILQISVPSKSLKPILVHYSRTWPGLLGSVLFAQGDRLIIGRILGLEAVGIYSVLTGLVNQINSFSALPVQPIISYLRNAIAKPKSEHTSIEISNLVGNAISLNTIVATGLGLVFVCFSPELTSILIPKSLTYSLNEIAFLLALLGSIYAIYSMNAVGYYLLLAQGKETMNSVVVLLCSLFTITAIWILTIKFGLFGAVIGNMGFFSTLTLLYIAYQQINFKPRSLFFYYGVPVLTFVAALTLALFNFNIFFRSVFFMLACGLIAVSNRNYVFNLLIVNKELLYRFINNRLRGMVR